MAARPDMTMMLVTHKAFRRDLGYLSDAAGRLDSRRRARAAGCGRGLAHPEGDADQPP